MSRNRTFTPLDTFPADWANSLGEFVSTLAANFQVLIPADPTTLTIPAGPDNAQAVIGINGRWRFNIAPVTASSPGGGAARQLDVWVTATDNSFSPGVPGETDNTDYSFAMAIVESGATPAGAVLLRRVATAHWDGSKFTAVDVLVGAQSGTARHAATHAATGPDPVSPASIGAAATADLTAESAARVAADGAEMSARASADAARVLTPSAAGVTQGDWVPVSTGGAAPGYIWQPRRRNHGVRVYSTSGLSIPNAAWTPFPFGHETYEDDPGMHSDTTNLSRLVCVTPGRYLITGVLNYAQAAGGNRYAGIWLNGGTPLAINSRQPGANTNADDYIAVSTVYQLNETDYVELQAYQSSGGALSVQSSGTYLAMELLSA